MTAQEIIQAVVAVAGNHPVQNCYVGITGNPRQRLTQHGVDLNDTNSYRIYEADNETICRVAEMALHKMGFDGDSGGGKGDGTAVYLYVYLKTSSKTNP